MSVKAEEFIDSLAEMVADKVFDRIVQFIKEAPKEKGKKEKKEKPKSVSQEERAATVKEAAKEESKHAITFDMMIQAAKNVAKQLNDAEPVKKTIAKFSRDPNEHGMKSVFEIDYPKLLEALDDLIGAE